MAKSQQATREPVRYTGSCTRCDKPMQFTADPSDTTFTENQGQYVRCKNCRWINWLVKDSLQGQR